MEKSIECTNCGKQKPNNEICPHCEDKPIKGYSVRTILLIVVGAVILTLGVNYLFEKDWTKAPRPPEKISNIEVYSSVKEYVKKNLKSPKTAEFPRAIESQNHVKKVDKNTFTVKSWVDSQNSFGALIRTKFICNVRYSNGKLYGSNLVFE